MASETTEDRPPIQFRLWWPVVAFLLMIAWSNIPPYRAHIRDEKRALLVWHWKLYQQGGAEVCDVRYFDMNEGGEPIERWKLLGYERPGAMPDKQGRTHHKQLFHAYAQVCDAMEEAGDPEPNVEVYARCGLDGGWKEVERRKRNVCDPHNRKRKRARNRNEARAARAARTAKKSDK